MLTALLLTLYSTAQVIPKDPAPELALGIKIITGRILFGPNQFYETDPGSVAIQPAGVRYDHPLRISRKEQPPKYVSIMGQAGFCFGKAKDQDSLYFHPKNPAYFTLSAGLYTISRLSLGAEIFFWKGLGNRDLFGAKFISAGYNGKNIRVSASGEYYMQLLNTRNNGILFSIDLFLKLIKGGADKPRK